jgi:Zn-dependent metalloprotease
MATDLFSQGLETWPETLPMQLNPTLRGAARSPALRVLDGSPLPFFPAVEISNPAESIDSDAVSCYHLLSDFVRFCSEVLNRNSIDGQGGDVCAIVHAFRTFGGLVLSDWAFAAVVLGQHNELNYTSAVTVERVGGACMMGVVAYSLRLGVRGQAGGLRRSIGDCFGSAFRQWTLNQTAAEADWLIGGDFLTEQARGAGKRCVHDLSDPGSSRCILPQLTHYRQIRPDSEPYEVSGVPSLAFYRACMTFGGRSWETVGQVWWSVVKNGTEGPDMTLLEFSLRTRHEAKLVSPEMERVIENAWFSVGVGRRITVALKR